MLGGVLILERLAGYAPEVDRNQNGCEESKC